MSFTGYLGYKLRQLYENLPAILWCLCLIGAHVAASSIYGEGYGELALVGYLLLSAAYYVVWVDYQDWKKEAEEHV